MLQLVAERLRCGQAVFPCGNGDIRFLRGVQGFKGHHTRGAARPQNRDTAGKRHPGALQRLCKTRAVGGIAGQPAVFILDCIDGVKKCRFCIQIVQMRNDRLFMGNGDVKPTEFP